MTENSEKILKSVGKNTVYRIYVGKKNWCFDFSNGLVKNAFLFHELLISTIDLFIVLLQLNINFCSYFYYYE